jgi:hypothetical protein
MVFGLPKNSPIQVDPVLLRVACICFQVELGSSLLQNPSAEDNPQ